MPVTATSKVQRAALRREGFRCRDEMWWMPLAVAGLAEARYRRLTPADVDGLMARYREHGRADLLDR